MPPSTVPVAVTTTQPLYQAAPQGQVLWWCRGPEPTCFTLNGISYTASVKSGLITSPYCSVEDVLEISVPEDQRHDYSAATLTRWLGIGAAKVNEFLGQRFAVPLSVWSDTIVWANCELTYIGATRKRGINSEALASEFHEREQGVLSWLKMSRDHEITPDSRLSAQDQPVQALRYLSAPSRGWEFGGGVGYSSTVIGFGRSRGY